jgi:hypothetical protein
VNFFACLIILPYEENGLVNIQEAGEKRISTPLPDGKT